jgi:hypothetical protein
MPRKSQSEIIKIKECVLSNIRHLNFTVHPRSDLGKSIYALNNNTIIDLIYSSLSETRNEYFFWN